MKNGPLCLIYTLPGIAALNRELTLASLRDARLLVLLPVGCSTDISFSSS